MKLPNSSTNPSSKVSPWEKLPDLPSPNGGFAAGSFGDSILIAGGSNWVNGKKQILPSAYRYDALASQWSRLEDLAYSFAYPLATVSSTSGGGKPALYILGGLDEEETLDRALAIGSDGKAVPLTWTLSKPLTFSAGCFLQKYFIHAGGTFDDADLSLATNKAFQIDLNTGRSSSLPDIPGEPFFLAAAAVENRNFCLFGGATFSDGKLANRCNAFVYSPESKKWRELSPYPIPARGITAVALDEDRIYLAGGYDSDSGDFCDRAYLYYASKDRYESTISIPYAGIVNLVLNNGYLYCLGGEDAAKHRSNAFYRIQLSDL